MPALLENHKEAIAELFRKYSVQVFFALGSAIRDDFVQGKAMWIFSSISLPLLVTR